MAGLNLGDLSSYERMLYGNVEDDPDLEAELLAIQNEMDDDDDGDDSYLASTSKRNIVVGGGRTNAPTSGGQQHRQNRPLEDIDRLARQISQEINVDDDENDATVDDDDELLDELNDVLSDDYVPPTRKGRSETTTNQAATTENPRDLIVLIEDRLTNYKDAQKAAKEANDAAKIRRLERGVATLNDQLKQARSGKSIDRSDIPPPVVATQPSKPMPSASSTPSLPQLVQPPPVPPRQPPIAPLPPPPPLDHPHESHHPALPKDAKFVLPPIAPKKTESPEKPTSTMAKKEDSTRDMLCQRRDQFRKAAMEAKQNGDKDAALDYFKTCKQFDKVIEAYDNGQDVDLTGMPSMAASPNRKSPPSAVARALSAEAPTMDESAFTEKATAAAFHAPPPPTTIMEALLQRLEKYKSAAEQAQQEGNSSKARRMGRIQKQYEDAIKAHRAGKPVDFDELPVPPGFGPIPTGAPSAAGGGRPASIAMGEKPATAAKPTAGASAAAGHRRPSPGGPSSSAAPPAKMSKQEQEMKFLIDRQHQFKLAALAAKKRGDMNGAKLLLKQALGFDQMIDGCKNGLRIDIASAPIPPQARTTAAAMKPSIGGGSTIVPTPVGLTAELRNEGDALAKAGHADVYSTLEQDLLHQIQICDRNREFFMNTGDVAKVTEFEQVANACKKDLAALRNSFKHSDAPPRFHYETRIFPSIKCFPELGADDLELTIVRGLQFKLPSGYEPKDADIYVKFELGYPKETPQTGKTAKVKGTNSPAFEYTSTMKINSKSRQFLHMLKRIGVKFEVMQKGGFLRSDICLGTAEVKLVTLETQPMIHQSVDIIENRKPVGGKLEVKVRVREPLVQKQAEEVREKWLIIDQFSVPTSASALAANRAAAFGSRPLGGQRTKFSDV